MKQLVLLKEGEYRANVFSDLVECINNMETSSLDREKINFFSRTDFTYRLHANTAGTGSGALALTTYLVDPEKANPDPEEFRDIDVEKMRVALGGHPFVLFATLAEDFAVEDSNVLMQGKYIVRDDNGHLIDYDTKEQLFVGGNDGVNSIAKDDIALFGLVKAKDLTVYYLIVDSAIVHIGQGFDYDHPHSDCVFRKVTDHDGTVKENVFSPSFGVGTTLVGKHDLFCTESEMTIKFFDDARSIIKSNELTELLPDLSVTVESNFEYVIENNEVKLTLDYNAADVGYVKITFDLGHFFANVQRKEAPTFEYVIHKI
jgi:hypothetical protein